MKNFDFILTFLKGSFISTTAFFGYLHLVNGDVTLIIPLATITGVVAIVWCLVVIIKLDIDARF